MEAGCALSQHLMHLFLSHWDLDGVVSAALLVRTARVLGLSYDYRLVTPHALPNYMGGGADVLLVADVAPQPGLVDRLAELLAGFERAVWIDHHEWPPGAAERLAGLPRLTLVRDTGRVAAELVRDYLRNGCGVDLEGYDELVELARLEDTSDTVSGDARLLRIVLRMSRWELRYRVVDELAANPVLPSWLRELGERLAKRYDDSVREAVRRARIYEAWCGARIVVVESPSHLHPGDLVAALTRLEGDVYLILYPDAVSLRSTVVPVNRIAWELGGGGHERAAGAPRPGLPASEIAERVGRIACSLVAERAGLGREIGLERSPGPGGERGLRLESSG